MGQLRSLAGSDTMKHVISDQAPKENRAFLKTCLPTCCASYKVLPSLEGTLGDVLGTVFAVRGQVGDGLVRVTLAMAYQIQECLASIDRQGFEPFKFIVT